MKALYKKVQSIVIFINMYNNPMASQIADLISLASGCYLKMYLQEGLVRSYFNLSLPHIKIAEIFQKKSDPEQKKTYKRRSTDSPTSESQLLDSWNQSRNLHVT